MLLLSATWSDKDGHMVKMQIVSPNEERPNPFKQFTKRKGGRAGTRFHASVAHVQGLKGKEVCYDGQFMLAGWQDTSTAGHSVTFWCEPPNDQRVHTFDGFRRGEDAFMVVLVELAEDDAPVNQEKRARVEDAEDELAGRRAKRAIEDDADPDGRERGQRLSQVAAIMCAYQPFWLWITSVDSAYGPPNRESAATWMRAHLGIESRRELDTDLLAADRFHATIRRPFVAWQEAHPVAGTGARSVGEPI